MAETRREMTRVEFAEAAQYAYEGHWLTGEEAFVHVAEVLAISGWNHHGKPGNLQLTEPQRVLLMWSDLVGQTANGGFEQFADNLEYALPVAATLIGQLRWPELTAHFTPALAEQKALLEERRFGERWVTYEPGMGLVERRRSRLIEQLGRSSTGFMFFKRGAETERLNSLTNDRLTMLYDEAVAAGRLQPEPAGRGNASEEFEEPVAPASTAFDSWLYLDETKAASRNFVGDYIQQNRDQLVRLTD